MSYARVADVEGRSTVRIEVSGDWNRLKFLNTAERDFFLILQES